ncbi:MAG: mechanosensitive ion channel family protein [Bacteroidetes bacterium]|nr:mechanosensitive ion channel family protein [Bacteroidota bacterium]
MKFLSSFLETVYFQNTIEQYGLFFLCLIAGMVLGKIIFFIFKTRLRKLTAKSKTKFDDYLIDIIEEPIVLLIFAGGFWLGKRFLTLNETFQKLFDNIVLVLISIVVTWFIIRFIDMLLKMYVEPIVEKSESKLDDQILPILRKSAKGTVLALAVIIVLSNMGYDIVSLLAGLGIGGLAIALAAQDAVKNIIGGFSIFWDKPFQIDEWIEVGGQSGSVKEVGLRSTRIKTIGGTTVVIPNSKVVDSTIENFSTRTRRRQVVTIGLTYDTTSPRMEEAMKIIDELIKGIEGVDHNDIMIRFVNFGAFSLDMEIVYWITDFDNWKMIIHEVNMKIKKELDEAGIEMAFPTETHYVITQK